MPEISLLPPTGALLTAFIVLSPNLAAIGPAAAMPLLITSCALDSALAAVSCAFVAAVSTDDFAACEVEEEEVSVAYLRRADLNCSKR